MAKLACPVCGRDLDPELAEELGLDLSSIELLHEKAVSKELVHLVRLGSVAENYLNPEQLSLESEFWKYVPQMMEKQRKLVDEIARAKEEERIKLLVQYEDQAVESRRELERLQSEHKEVVAHIQADLTSIKEKIVGAGIGKVGELRTIKDLQSAFPQDDFTDKHADKKGSDIVAEVREEAKALGRAVISVKYQDKWNRGFLDQLERNLDEERTPWGMLVTRVFPANALNDRAYMTKERLFIVKPAYATVAYYGLREAMRASHKAALQAKTVVEKVRQERRILSGLQKWVSGERLQEVLQAIKEAKKAADDTDDLVRNWQGYAKQQGEKVRRKTQKLVERLLLSEELMRGLQESLSKPESKSAASRQSQKRGKRRIPAG